MNKNGQPYGLGWIVNWANPITWFFVAAITSFYLVHFFLDKPNKYKRSVFLQGGPQSDLYYTHYYLDPPISTYDFLLK